MHALNEKSAKYFHFHVKTLCILCIHACHDALENTWLSAALAWRVILGMCVVYLVTPECKHVLSERSRAL